MSKSLYEQLKAGTSAEDIVAAFTAELNAAEEQLRAEREAKAKAEAEKVREAAKIDEAVDLLRKAAAFISHYYPSFGFDGDLTEDEYYVLAKLMLLTLDAEPAKKQLTVKTHINTEAAKPTLDDTFADFFKTFGL